MADPYDVTAACEERRRRLYGGGGFPYPHDEGGYICVCPHLQATLDAGKAEAEAALDEILRIGERHVDEATGRRIADFNEAIAVAQCAQGGDDG